MELSSSGSIRAYTSDLGPFHATTCPCHFPANQTLNFRILASAVIISLRNWAELGEEKTSATSPTLAIVISRRHSITTAAKTPLPLVTPASTAKMMLSRCSLGLISIGRRLPRVIQIISLSHPAETASSIMLWGIVNSRLQWHDDLIWAILRDYS